MSKAKEFLTETSQPNPKTFLVGHSGRKYKFVVNTDNETDSTYFSIEDNRTNGGVIKDIDVEDINTFIAVLNHIKKNLKK